MRAPEDRLNSLQSKLDAVTERRKARREKYEASDKKDADREKALRGDILRAEKTIEFNEQLDAELARLNEADESKVGVELSDGSVAPVSVGNDDSRAAAEHDAELFSNNDDELEDGQPTWDHS